MRPRVIPCVLLRGEGLVKTTRFRAPRYVGDPINTVRLFNDKEVDELIVLDISATGEGRPPSFGCAQSVADECFMPLCFGGGVRRLEEASRLFDVGIEKVAVNTAAWESPELVTAIANRYGSQSVVVGIDVRRRWLGRYEVVVRGGHLRTGTDPVDHARVMARAGAGEILLTAVDRDGTMAGYDLDLISRVSGAVDLPVVACGGAGGLGDFAKALERGASAVAAGSFFVFKGPHRAVLVTYPSASELEGIAGS